MSTVPSAELFFIHGDIVCYKQKHSLLYYQTIGSFSRRTVFDKGGGFLVDF